MEQKVGHSKVVVNSFAIYIGFGILAVLLQQLLALFFVPQLFLVSWA